MTNSTSLNNEKENRKIINFEETVKRYGDNPDTVKEILQMLVQSFSEEIPKIQAAKEKNDLDALPKLVHRLKGSAAYCGAELLQLACSDLEDCLRSGELKDKELLYDQLLKEVESVKKEIPRFL